MILRMKVRRYKCKCADCDYDCQERISFAPGSHSYTRRFARYVVDLLKGMTLKDTAHLLGVSWDTIKRRAVSLRPEFGLSISSKNNPTD